MKQFKQLRNRHLFFADLILLPAAVYLSYVLRLDRLDIAPFWPSFLLYAPVATAVVIIVFKAVGLYARYWRYASVDELLLLTGATTISVVGASAVTAVFVWLIFPTYNYPRSIPLIFLLLSLAVTAGPRLLVNLLSRSPNDPYAQERPRKPILIMGAGDAGVMIVREIRHNSALGLKVVGLLDDDPRKHGMSIYGIPVLGGREQIPTVVARLRVKQVIIAMPTVAGPTVREIVALCEKSAVATKIIPGINEILDGTISVNQLRDVNIEDLLRRQPVQTDTRLIQTTLRGRRVLVTGGGGSIGSELCRQILRCHPRELILLGHGENSIFEIYHELRRWQMSDVIIRPVIADIRFAQRIQHIFAEYQPEIVFHAAAHKHVPLMEANPVEAITNNVVGTRNLLAAAVAVGVERFVMVSTDKAVNPTSIMGASKRAAELLVHQAARQCGRPYVAVRFGNVLGSRGSVALTFKRQIAAGGPVTVTHPDMVRYFMTIPEAVQLVLQAAVLGHGGEVFMLDMGKPVKIVDLARDLIQLSGLEVGRDIEIVYTGSRPGEKLFEELFTAGEAYRPTLHKKIFVAASATNPDLVSLETALIAVEEAVANNDPQAVVVALRHLIPEFDHVDATTSASSDVAVRPISLSTASAKKAPGGQKAVAGLALTN